MIWRGHSAKTRQNARYLVPVRVPQLRPVKTVESDSVKSHLKSTQEDQIYIVVGQTKRSY